MSLRVNGCFWDICLDSEHGSLRDSLSQLLSECSSNWQGTLENVIIYILGCKQPNHCIYLDFTWCLPTLTSWLILRTIRLIFPKIHQCSLRHLRKNLHSYKKGFERRIYYACDRHVANEWVNIKFSWYFSGFSKWNAWTVALLNLHVSSSLRLTKYELDKINTRLASCLLIIHVSKKTVSLNVVSTWKIHGGCNSE